MHEVFIAVISFIAAFLSSMSGAGASMIAIPAWVSFGYSLPAALAANALNGALWTPVAARNYLHDVRVDVPLVILMTISGLIGAWLGTETVIELDPLFLRRVVGLLILLLAGFMFVHKDFGTKRQASSCPAAAAAAGGFPLGFYEAFFGAGNGIFTSVLLVKAKGFELPVALGYYYVVSCFWCAFAAILYIEKGYGVAELMIPSSIGAFAGAFCGSRIGKRSGALFVKRLVLMLGTILGLKLLLPA